MTTDFSSVPGVDGSIYNNNNFTGFMTLPVGDLNFMTQTEIQGANVYNGYTQYNFQHPGANGFHDPTFIDANGPG